MTPDNSPIITTLTEQIGVITINNPPVNALSQPVRKGLLDAIETLDNNDCCKIIIIQCLGRTFIAGADIREFGSAPVKPYLPDVVNRIEACQKPVIASLFGTTLGGGLEVALACHYRVALSKSKVGMPEVNLGLIPGAGGTQRLMRLVGIETALSMITTGKHILVDDLQHTGLFDGIFSSSSDEPLIVLQQMTQTFCRQLLANEQLPVNPVGTRPVNSRGVDWESLKSTIQHRARGRIAPLVALDVIQNTVGKNIIDGMAIEREAFAKLVVSEQSSALRHVFAAERKAVKSNVDAKAEKIETVGIVGGGTMGVGISTTFLIAGYSIFLIENNPPAAKKALENIAKNLQSNVDSGRMSEESAEQCLHVLKVGTDQSVLSKCQLIIEAIFEDIELKKVLFQQLDAICLPTTIFASNTSYLDINQIAASTQFPDRVIGMHFFSPAHIMKLLEIIQTDKTSPQVLATAMQIGKRLGKISVLVQICYGFAGNRMFSRYCREVQQMLLEGATVDQVDSALTQWGMAMGPFAVQDLAGIDIGYKARQSRADPIDDPGYFKVSTALVEHDRLGRKTQLGFYRYDSDGKAHSEPETDKMIKTISKGLGISQRKFTDEEIVERALYSLISEGFKLYHEGIVQRLSDIDVIWIHGYGYPRYRGGPMFQAQIIGFNTLTSKMKKLCDEYGEGLWPVLNYEIK